MSAYDVQRATPAPSESMHAGIDGSVRASLHRFTRAQRTRRAQDDPSAVTPVSADPAGAAMAELAHGLAQALMQGVQRVAELNIDTTRTLLSQGGSAANARLDGAADAWRFSWRSYEICATTAATILKLCQSQARASFDDLWRALEDGLAQVPHVELARLRETRTAFEAMRGAYTAYFDAALATHRALLSLAAGAR